MPTRPAMPEVVSRTMFSQDAGTSQWNWATKSLSNEVVAQGTEGGYGSLREAIQGFFDSQNVEYQTFGKWPANYGPLTMVPENMYQINKYLSQGN